MKLCVFPNDPIQAYYEKGEIKPRYFNPKNFFEEIHIISLIEKDVAESKVNITAGNASLKIHSVGKINIKNRTKHKDKILSLVKSINPDIIRAYNPLVQGWLAAYCADKLKIPLFVSLHIQIDMLRRLYKKNNFKRYLSLKYSEKFIEPFVLKKADKITIVYKIIEPYVLRHCNNKPELLYNRIDTKRFGNGVRIDSLSQPLVISVGRLTKQKNHQCIIKAMKNIEGHLLIIGNGELYDELSNLIKSMKLDKKITIKKSVPNEEIQNYYKSANLFALAYDTNLEGLPIPVMEAMASGLPVVIPYPKKGFSDGLEETALFSKVEPTSFAKNMNEILNNKKLQEELSIKSLKKSKQFDQEIIEKREAEIYHGLSKNNNMQNRL